MSFVPYLSKPFNYSGRMDWGSSTDTYAWAHRLDMNGDGYDDVVEGWCPSWCLYRQEPYRQLVTAPIAGPVPGVGIDTYYATLGDIDGDGLPDRVQSGFDNWVHVDLQTAENTFSSVGGFYYVYNGGYPVIADFDLNGYADIAIADQDGLSYYMQEAPGDFRGVFFQTFRYYDFARMIAGDFNGDGCPDLLLTSPEDAKYTRGQLSLFRGLHCKGHGDLAVHAAATATRITVDVAATGDAYKDREVRVVIAPALRDDAPLGLEVRAPAGCIPTPSERPRRMFDCLVAVAANQTTQLVFPYTYAPGFAQSVELQATAFLLNGNADSRPGNNRARTAVMIGSPAAPTGGMGAGTTASKHTTPTGAPRGTARSRRGAAP
jgi:hypothetical protein